MTAKFVGSELARFIPGREIQQGEAKRTRDASDVLGAAGKGSRALDGRARDLQEVPGGVDG